MPLIKKHYVIFLLLIAGESYAVAPPANTAEKPEVKSSSSEDINAVKKRVFGTENLSKQNGEKRFNQSCVYCHGYEGSGGKARPLQGRDLDADYLFKTISNGKRKGALVMPPWKKSLSVEQRWELVVYISSLSSLKK
ncbi:cytochrome c [Enterovibrio sp. ZSDZ42]|uniref:Cytochrome c n=1 Tax=Enterovibrio gelatinilyticus TaxID=2899819 RepID=A0ABT5QW39_9GAMM|nr:cytochrome c [Enterovibrio sp. ZSDZ42]MDD1792228.1 cytochrome c [Enterovibrio sp. ZSDZ42]